MTCLPPVSQAMIALYDHFTHVGGSRRDLIAGMAKLAGGRIWRYELEPVDGGTLVRETWDISKEVVPALVRPLRAKTSKAMAATLERIEARVVAS